MFAELIINLVSNIYRNKQKYAQVYQRYFALTSEGCNFAAVGSNTLIEIGQSPGRGQFSGSVLVCFVGLGCMLFSILLVSVC